MAKSPKPLIISLCIIAALMFGFTFALIPLYNVFCSITGLNGKIDSKFPEQFTRTKIHDPTIGERRVVVEFDTNRNATVPCELSATQALLQVIPGELAHTTFRVKNLSDKKIVIQAIPSISPGHVAKHLKKLECFCFDQQTVEAGETKDLPLRFWLETEIPKNVHRLTLSYTLFDVTARTKEKGT